MNADAMATRMSVLTRALPTRILLVDDEQQELDSMAERLRAAGFEVSCAQNGAHALEILQKQWFPLVMTDWQMPVMDGVQFAEALRSRGVDDTYLIMLTTRDGRLDYERGYAAGVDDYVAKKVPDAELFARIHAAFNTLALRRSLKETRAALQAAATLDEESGVFTTSEVYTRLHAEIRRAQRYGRQLSIITVGVQHAPDPRSPQFAPGVLHAVASTLNNAVRAHVDWVGRLTESAGAAFAVVLPEAGIADTPAIKERLSSALKKWAAHQPSAMVFTFGVTALERDGAQGVAVDAKQMLDVAERCRACSGRVGTEQLATVQRSVVCRVAIACRHGYAVAPECPLSSENTKTTRRVAATG